ncbi:hypothetical protein OA978_01405 [Candidatus Pelagibacter sp.]|nr:hypothetical protein [Candidatus Pelagibacter sp.]
MSNSEKDGWKAVFKSKILGPMCIGFIISIVGMFTPYEYELGFVGLGMVVIGFYFWFSEM